MPNNNSSRNNAIVIIAALTILLFAGLMMLISFRDTIIKSLRTPQSTLSEQEIAEAFNDYLEAGDYVGLSNYADLNKIEISWGSDLYDYSYVRYACSNYSYLLTQLMELHLSNRFIYYEYYPQSITNYVRNIYRYYDPESVMAEYNLNIISDMNMLLKTYLNFTDDELVGLSEMSDDELTTLVDSKVQVIMNERQ